ncbi:MAG: glycoside hydrolase family 3 N-terminal domain-containing protein [Streptosporangiaceae bacterium]
MTPRRLYACVAALGLACSACSAGVSASGIPTPTPSQSSSSSSCPAQIFSRMTEAQRVGQLFLVGIAGDPIAEVAKAVATYHFGSLLYGTNTTAGVTQTRRETREMQALASSYATAGVRFFIAANQEGGEVQNMQGPGFAEIPPALDQGMLTPGDLQRQAADWGRELSSAGINLNLAPVMDVVPAGTAASNQPIGALQREFGDTPAAVADHGVAFIRGMQQAGVATTAKHFPGLGRVQGNTDFTAGVVDTVTTSDDPYLQTFQDGIDAGVPFVMAALATYTLIDPKHLAAFSTRVMRTMLRQQMHFRGVIVSDDLGVAAAVAGIPPASRGIDFLAAGGDMITSESLTAATEMDAGILERAAMDPAFRAEVNSAVRYVLSAKQAYHLLSCS